MKAPRSTHPYISVKGQWKYLYRAVDQTGRTVDFLLTAKRNRKAALRFLRKAIDQGGTPQKINIDRSGANTVASAKLSIASCAPIARSNTSGHL